MIKPSTYRLLRSLMSFVSFAAMFAVSTGTERNPWAVGVTAVGMLALFFLLVWLEHRSEKRRPRIPYADHLQ